MEYSWILPAKSTLYLSAARFTSRSELNLLKLPYVSCLDPHMQPALANTQWMNLATPVSITLPAADGFPNFGLLAINPNSRSAKVTFSIIVPVPELCDDACAQLYISLVIVDSQPAGTNLRVDQYTWPR